MQVTELSSDVFPPHGNCSPSVKDASSQLFYTIVILLKFLCHRAYVEIKSLIGSAITNGYH